MGTQQKFSANGTYVFDPDEIEQLDEFSMTSLLSAAVDAIPQDQSETELCDIVATESLGNTTINALLGRTTRVRR